MKKIMLPFLFVVYIVASLGAQSSMKPKSIEFKSALQHIDYLPNYFFALFDQPQKIYKGEAFDLHNREFYGSVNEKMNVAYTKDREGKIISITIDEMHVGCSGHAEPRSYSYAIEYDEQARVSIITLGNYSKGYLEFKYSSGMMTVELKELRSIRWEFNMNDQTYSFNVGERRSSNKIDLIHKNKVVSEVEHTPEAQSFYEITFLEFDSKARLKMATWAHTNSDPEYTELIGIDQWSSCLMFMY